MAEVKVSRRPAFIGQIARYGIAGLLVNLALYGFYLLVVAFGLTPIVASTLAFALGIPISLTTHRRFTFRANAVSTGRKALFVLSYVLGYIVKIVTLLALYHGLGLPHQLAQAVAICVVAAVLFVSHRRIVFQK